MRDLFIILFLVFGLVFASCSSLGGGSKTDYPSEVKSGNGLSVDFNVDTREIKGGKLRYDISLKNAGTDEIILSRDNFVLNTDITRKVFVDSSIESFYNDVLENGNLVLYPNQEKEMGGVFQFDPNFLDTRVAPDFKLILSVNYDYETKFDSTVSLSKDSGIWEIKSDNSNQAAPVKISKLDLELDRGSNYFLIFYFEDSGQNGNLLSKNVLIEIENFQAKLGTGSLSCMPFYYDGKYFTSSNGFIINSDKDDLIARCSVSLGDLSDYTSKVVANFDYNYKMKFEEGVSFPDN